MAYQAPAIRPLRANGSRRDAQIYFHRATKASGDNYGPCDLSIEAGRCQGGRPTVWISSDAIGTGPAASFDLKCDELIALGALATITIECLAEDQGVRGNVTASDDPDLDKAEEDRILADLERGNEWAWCVVRVTATWLGYTGSDVMGGNSYASEAAFQADAYYDDMVDNALTALRDSIKGLRENMERAIGGVRR